MARESYHSLYGDLTKLKDDSLLKDPASGTGDDDELFQLLLLVPIGWTTIATATSIPGPIPWSSTAGARHSYWCPT